MRQFYNENSVYALIVQGILDALAAGILTFDGLVNILQPHFKSNAFKSSNRREKGVQLGSLYLGAAVMAVIAKWM